MKEELRKAYRNKEKAELLLANLSNLSNDNSISDDQRKASRIEYSKMLDDANRSIKALKSKLRKEFNSKADELESLKRELALLTGRFELGEITARSYNEQASSLNKSSKRLEKEVLALNTLVHSSCSDDLSSSSSKINKKTAREVPSMDSRRRFSMGTVLVICLMVVITAFVIVFAVVKESTPNSQASTAATTNTTTGDSLVVISNINVSNVTATEAVVTWDTNKPTRSQLEFGTTSNMDAETSLSEELKLSHLIHLSGLNPDTIYYYRIKSINVEGEETTSAIYEINTAGDQHDGTMLAISEINVSDVTDSSATITWLTDKEATGQVEYGPTPDYSLLTPLNESLSTTHKIQLSGLNQGGVYYFRVRSKDNAGNEAISDAGTTFITLSSALISSLEGKEAPDFTVLSLKGQSVTLKNLRGKWLMLVFWEAKCGACRSEMPHLQEYFQSRANDEPLLLAVNVREKEAFVQTYVESQGLTFTVLLDSMGVVATKYKIKGFPTAFLIDADGIIKKEIKQVLESAGEIEDIVNSTMGSN